METLDLMTLGYGASIFQENPRDLEGALRVLKLAPSLIVNGIAHYRAVDIKAARQLLLNIDADQMAEAAKKKAAD